MSDPLALEACAQLGLSLVSAVGSGSFKQTFHVTDSTNHPWALKIFAQSGPDDRSEREMNAMLRCNHTGIAKLGHVDTLQLGTERHLISLEEYIDGGNLTSRITTKLYDRSAGVALAIALAEAVEHLAGLDLVHRDIKPDNIMVRANGEPVLVDLGLVRDLREGSLTPSWAPRGPGTPFFAAPEQLRNEKPLISWQTDQFSIAIVIFVSCFGYHPYRPTGASDIDAIRMVAERQRLPTESANIISANNLDVLAKCSIRGRFNACVRQLNSYHN